MLRGEPQALRAAYHSPVMGAIRSQGYMSRDVSTYYARVGLPDEAVELLTHAVSRGISDHPLLAELHPFLEPLRADPRFAALMERVHAAWCAFDP
jgi:uncharacterized protein HemY